jgi:hypothetical protein
MYLFCLSIITQPIFAAIFILGAMLLAEPGSASDLISGCSDNLEGRVASPEANAVCRALAVSDIGAGMDAASNEAVNRANAMPRPG